MLPKGLKLSAVEPGGGSPPPPAPTPSAVPGASPAPGSSVAPPATSPGNDGNVRQLREQYETTKQKLEPWERLGFKPEDAQRSHQTYTKIVTEVTNLGTQLGYTSEEIQQAMETDPAGTLAALRQMAKQPESDKPLTRAEIERLADQRAKDALKPFQQEREQRLDKEAETRFDGEFDRQFKTSFPNGLPDSSREALSGLAWQLVSDNKEGYGALRAKGDVASIAAAFNQAKTTLLKILSDYGEHEKKRTGGTPPQPNGGGGKKPQTLDDIINRAGNLSVPQSEIFV